MEHRKPMKRLLIGLALCLGSTTSFALSILFVGNSFTHEGPVPEIVRQMAIDAGYTSPTIGFSAPGGVSLTNHFNRQNGSVAMDMIALGGWDVVVLQENSTRSTDTLGYPDIFKARATDIYDYVKTYNPGASVVLYETWAREQNHPYYPGTFADPEVMQAQVRFHYYDAFQRYIPTNAATAVGTNDLKIAPVGDAWNRLIWLEGSDIRLHRQDDYHAGSAGRYLNALVLFGRIYNQSVIGLPSQLGLNATTTTYLQNIAQTALNGTPEENTNFRDGETAYVDLGATVVNGYAALTNNTNGVVDALTSDGRSTGIGAVVTDNFNGKNTNGRSDNTLGLPGGVTVDTFWVSAGQKGTIELRYLKPDHSYTIALFGSRTGNDGGNGYLTRYTVNGSNFQDLNAADNTGNQAVFNPVQPDSSGTVTIDVETSPAGTANYAFLNLISITDNGRTTPLAQTLQVSQDSFEFLPLTIGNTALRTLMLSNQGDSNLSIGQLVFQSNPSAAFSIATDNCSNLSIAPLQTCSVTLQFSPASAGSHTATVTVPSDDPSDPSHSVTLLGDGRTAIPQRIQSLDETVNYGSLALGASQGRTLLLTNVGDSNLTISSLSFSGTDSAAMGMNSDLCTGANLASGASCEFNMAFSPYFNGSHTANVIINSNDPQTPALSIPIFGKGGASGGAGGANIAASANPLMFGDVILGATGSQTLTISNLGNAALNISSTNLQNIVGAGFTVNSDLCSGSSLAAGSTCDIQIDFTPSANQSYSSQLTVNSDDPDEPSLVVDINGNGINASANGFVDGAVIEIDLGSTSRPTAGINNLTNFTNLPLTLNATGGASTTVTVDITSPFVGTNSSGIEANTIGLDPDTTYDNLFGGNSAGHAQALGQVSRLVIGNLDPNANYSITLFASRTGNDGGLGRLSRYTINGLISQDLDATDNTSQTVTFNNIQADTSGQISVEVAVSPNGNARYSYLGYLALSHQGSNGSSTPSVSTSTQAFGFGDVATNNTVQQTLTISNNGGAPLTVAPLQLSGANASDFGLVNDNCSNTQLAASAQCSVDVSFTPSNAGLRQAVLTILSDDPINQSVTVDLDGTGTTTSAQNISATPNPIDFGTIAVSNSDSRVIQITNTGDATLTLGNIVVIDGQGNGFSIQQDNCSTVALAGQGSCNVTILFSPLSEGTYQATVSIPSDDPDTPNLSIPLAGAASNADNGFTTGAVIEIDLGSTTRMTPSINNLTNFTNLPLALNTSGGSPTSVTINITAPFVGTNTNGIEANTIGLDADTTFDNLFGGDSAGHAQALAQVSRLVISNLDPNAQYGLTLFASRTGNDGGLGRLTRYTINGVNYADLDASDNTSETVQFDNVQPDSGGQIAIEVTVSPDGTSRFTYLGYLALTHQGGGGASSPVINTNTQAMNFGSVSTVGNATQTLNVSNIGGSTLNIAGILLSGTNVGDFSLVSDACSGNQLSPGAQCAVDVNFAPASPGTMQALLTIYTDDPVNPSLTINLSGTATTATAQNISATPDPVDFGFALVSSSDSRTIQVNNTGDLPLTLGNALIIDGQGNGFSIQTDNCSSTVLQGQETCTLDITFEPLAEGTYDADLMIPSDDADTPELYIPLSGVGTSVNNGFDVGEVIEIDVGSFEATYPTFSINNITGGTSLPLVLNTSSGGNTSVSVDITNPFIGTNKNGIGANTLGLDGTITIDSFFGGDGAGHAQALLQVSSLVISNLDPLARYDLVLFASRTGDDSGLGRLVQYTINSVLQQDLDVADNTSQTAQFANVQPDNSGNITIDVAVSPNGTARYSYLGYIAISRTQ